MNPIRTNEIQRAIETAAIKIKRDYGTRFFTLDDYMQECFLWSLNNQRYLDKLAESRLFAYVYVSCCNRLKRLLYSIDYASTVGDYQDAVSFRFLDSSTVKYFGLLDRRRVVVLEYIKQKSKFAKKSSSVETIVRMTLDNRSISEISNALGRKYNSVDGSIKAFVKRARRDLEWIKI